MQKLTTLFICTLLLYPVLSAQNVGINTDGSVPHHSAILDVKSNNMGVLVPRLSMLQRDSINRPAESLLIYQTDSLPGFYYYDGHKWVMLGASVDGKILGPAWDTDGNVIPDSSKFLGTTNNYNLIIKTNNTEKMRVTNTGRVGINAPYPSAALHVKHAWTAIFGGGGTTINGSDIGLRIESFQGSVIVGAGQYNPNKWDFSSNLSSLKISNPITNNNAITILNNGNVGFGVSAPKTKLHVNGKVLIGAVNVLPSSPYANYMLAVRGTVIAQKYVASLEDWPDYVFECADEQPTLEEQKTYWQTHNHLLGVPSREEILQNGASLGDLQINLVEKLEQAYLYIDQLNQRLQELESKMKELEGK